MREAEPDSSRGLNRAAYGLWIVAVGWTLAIVMGQPDEDSRIVWVIPVAAALFGVALFRQARRAGNRQE